MHDLDFGQTIKGFIPAQKLYGRYRLERQLGRGGMGVVWLAFDEKLERNVALKFLPGMVTADAVAIDDLKRETRRCLDLTHPNIVRIYDFVDDSDSAAISMEYVDGETLSERRLSKPNRAFEVEEIRDWMCSLCEALAYAHAQCRVVHRDLKPANLMLTGKGVLKVADFGIARSISDSISRVSVQAASTAGTLVYMSPEQAQGQPPSALDDIYSIGATIYELLTGKPPFYSGNIQHQIETITPPAMARRRAELGVEGQPIPPAWETAVAACLEKDATRRPQNALTLRDMLEGAAPASSKKQGEPAPPAAGIPAQGNRGVLVAALVIAALLGGGAGYFGIYEPGQRRKLEAEEAHRAQAETETKKREAERAAAIAFAESQAKDSVQSRRWDAAENAISQLAQLDAQNASLARLRESVAAGKRQDVIDAEMAKAMAAIERKDWDHAGQATDLVLKMDPGNRSARSLAGRISDEKAAEALRKQVEAALAVAKEALANKDWDGAVKAAQKAISLAPQNKEAADLLAEIGRQKKLSERPPGLSESGYFSLSELFEKGPYADYNRYSRTNILKRVQQKLAAKEHYAGQADGVPGRGTEDALIAFQRAEDLPVTGLLDSATIQALDLSGISEMTEPTPTPAPRQEPAPSQSSSSLPYATPVVGRPGYVRSPYSPYAGYIDVRGYPPNTEVKDPYSGKIFLVP